MNNAIETAESRLEIAKKVHDDLANHDTTEIGQYTVVDDGQDRWIANTEELEEAGEDLSVRILDGSLTLDLDDYGFCVAYETVCRKCNHWIGKDGLGVFLSQYDGSINELLEIFEAMAIEDDELPNMIRTVNGYGERHSGGTAAKCVEVAQKWITAGVDDADKWMDIGFWNPSPARSLAGIGITPSMVSERAEQLVADVEDPDNSPYTDDCPIYSVCNNDTNLRVLIPGNTPVL